MEVTLIGTDRRDDDHVSPPSSVHRIHCPPTSWHLHDTLLSGIVVMMPALYVKIAYLKRGFVGGRGRNTTKL